MVKKIFKNPQAVIGLIFISIVILMAVCASIIAPNNPELVDISMKFQKPNSQYPFGTDQLGRCVFSRLVYGAKYSLGIAIPVMLSTMIISVFIGTISSYIGGKLDMFFSVIFDIFMAFPPIVVALSLVGSLGQEIKNIVIALIFSTWVWSAKVVRSCILEEKNKEYIISAKVVGASDIDIILKHIIPNIFPTLLVYFSNGIASVVLMISGFSFLGIGIEAGLPEWGAMLNNGRAFLYSHPELIYYPGICIFFTATGFTLFAEALRDIISPEEV